MNNRSQMEILGLAIVVVLILVATIFVVRFLVIKSPTEYRKGFISAELASNMLSTFLKTAAGDCSQLTMTELLQDCAQARSINCGNGQDSCSYVESTAKHIFESTFDNDGRGGKAGSSETGKGIGSFRVLTPLQIIPGASEP